jgi:type I restriction enzyme S subunit
MQETLFDDMGTPEPEGQDNGEAPPEPGFKKTKVGWIPEEWEVRQMRDVVQDVSAGRSIGGEERNIEDDEKGVLRTSAVTSGKFIPEEHKVVDPDDYDRLKKNPEEGDILFNRASGSLELVGVSVRVSSDYPNLFLSDKLWRIKADRNVSEKWLHHALESEHVVGRIRMYADSRSTGMKNIPQGDFLTIRVATPPPEEQRRTAEILSSWDRAIEQIDDLIAVKERRKKALMQQLLKGKTRLPGYGDEDWVEVRIGDLLKRVKRYVDWDDDAQYDLVSVKRGSEGLYHRKSIYGHEKKTKKLHKGGRFRNFPDAGRAWSDSVRHARI